MKIHAYIEANRDCVYSSEFPVLLGNMLPEKYENSDDTFDFDSFYNDLLLKLFTEAENLIVYVTPFVLGIDLSVVIYDFGEKCFIENKELPCGLKEAASISVLYRKNHYDFAYNSTAFEKIRDYTDYIWWNKTDVLSSVMIVNSKKERENKKLQEERDLAVNEEVEPEVNFGIKEDSVNIQVNEVIIDKEELMCEQPVKQAVIKKEFELITLPCQCTITREPDIFEAFSVAVRNNGF